MTVSFAWNCSVETCMGLISGPVALLAKNMKKPKFHRAPVMHHQMLNYIKSSDAEPCLHFCLSAQGEMFGKWEEINKKFKC